MSAQQSVVTLRMGSRNSKRFERYLITRLWDGKSDPGTQEIGEVKDDVDASQLGFLKFNNIIK